MRDEYSWRVGHQGRDRMYYEEFVDGSWRRIEIEGEMLVGPAHHVIYFDSPERWQSYPEWARHRRDELIARIVSEFREPDYEYFGLGPVTPNDTVPATQHDAPSGRANESAAHKPTARRAPETRTGALMIAIALLIVMSASMGWLVARGLATGTSIMPSTRPSQRRPVVRASEPAMYWAAIGVYSTLSLGTAGLGLLCLRAWPRRDT